MKTFDIVVDAQNDFMRTNGKLYVTGAEAIIPALQTYIATLSSTGVLFTYDTHLEGVYEASAEAKEFPIHCVKDTEGWQLAVNRSAVRVPVYLLEKGVFDMWKEPALYVQPDGRYQLIDRDIFFSELKRKDVTKVRVTGVAADYCVKWAIDGLVARGFAVEVVEGLTVGIGRGIEQVVQEDFADQPVVVRT
jgi:nicotinamidase/pyrazinamidase